MARGKKTDPAKKADKTVQDTSKEPEVLETGQDIPQEPEAAEADQDTSTEPEAAEADQDTSTEPEAAEADQDTSKEPETTETGQDIQKEPDVFAELPGPLACCIDRLPNPCVYCGPSVRGVARQYTTYQGGISDALCEFIKEHPDALGLIVSTEKFPAMRKRLETLGTPEARLYKAVKAEL